MVLLETSTPTYSFSSIERVPSDIIGKVIVSVLNRYGQMTTEELLKSVARELGFRHTGPKISANNQEKAVGASSCAKSRTI